MDENQQFEVFQIQGEGSYDFVTEEVANDESILLLCEDDVEQNIKPDVQIEGSSLLSFPFFMFLD